MRQVTANEVKQSFRKILDAAQREPVVFTRYNRNVAVLLSMQDYEKLTAAHVDAFERFCDKVGTQAKSKGLTEDKLNKILI